VAGHPRRYAAIMEYPSLAHLQPMNVFMSIFAISMGLAQIPFLYNFFVSMPRSLGRAMVALFTVAFGFPLIAGAVFYNRYSVELQNTGGAVMFAVLAGLIFAAVTVGLVFAIWEFGRAVSAPALLQKLLYAITLPMFLSPALLKKDMYMWISMPELHDYRWLLMALMVMPGMLYLLVWRPKDEFGYLPGDNPWEANTLEWSIPSPPPFHNFDEIPTVHRGPYEYSSPAVEEDFLPQQLQLPPGVVEPAGH
jgi:hypothetical protein